MSSREAGMRWMLGLKGISSKKKIWDGLRKNNRKLRSIWHGSDESSEVTNSGARPLFLRQSNEQGGGGF